MSADVVVNILWSVLGVIYAGTVIVVLGIIISENRSPVRALAWVMVLVTIPIVGLVIYMVFGRNIRSRRILRRSQRRKLKQRSEGKPLSFTHSKLSEECHTLIRLASSLGAPPAQIGNNVELFYKGYNKFEKMLADLESAQEYIMIQYYILADDEIGNRICNILRKKVAEGVKVSMIYDPVGSFPTKKRFFRKLCADGVDAKPFYPVKFPGMGVKINWRNHRKICVIDGKTGYIGGMNIADRYIDGGESFNMWRDLHLRVTGPIVASLESSFIADWNFLAEDIDRFLRSKKTRWELQKEEIVTQFVSSGPTSPWYTIELLFLKAISLAKKRVFIVTPYFLPTEGLLSALQSASLSRVDVRIMVPLKSDSKMLTYATSSYVTQCLRAGIKFYFFRPGMLHSKMLLVDDDITSIGSTNFDFRSFEHNFESNLFVYSKRFNERAAEVFFRDMAESDHINIEQWKKRSLKRRAAESLTRLFAPIL